MSVNESDTPRTVASRAVSAAQRGMTLIEIMVVIVIIGILGSAMAYGVFGLLGDAKIDTCKAQIHTIAQQVQFWEAKKGDYPASLQAMTEGNTAPLRVEQLKDPWQQEILYSAEGSGGGKFTLCSKGPDKKQGSEDDICFGQKK